MESVRVRQRETSRDYHFARWVSEHQHRGEERLSKEQEEAKRFTVR